MSCIYTAGRASVHFLSREWVSGLMPRLPEQLISCLQQGGCYAYVVYRRVFLAKPDLADGKTCLLLLLAAVCV
jgi:hypothetical protein